MKTFINHLEESCNCWKGYKRKPGTAPCAEGSCIKESKRGLWDNIHAKQKRIKAGSGEHMRKPGSEGAPTDAALKASQTNEEIELSEATADQLGDMIDNAKSTEHAKSIIAKAPTKHLQYLHYWNMGLSGARTHKDMPHIKAELSKRKSLLSDTESAKRFDEAANMAQQAAIAIAMKKAGKKPKNEEVEAQFDLIESVVEELALLHNIDPEVLWEKFEEFTDEQLLEYAVDAKGHKSSTGGLTQKGRDAYNAHGAHLQAPVTTPPSKLKAGSKAANRRKSFCARMGGMEGPMKKPNGKPTRKALALRKWNC
jgi:hypothetical protein